MSLSFLKKALPWIGAAAGAVATGGPIGLIGVAVKGISQVVGHDVKPDIDSISAALAGATPDQLLALKKLDDDTAVAMKQLGFQNEVELEQTFAADRASAREREVKLVDYMPKALGIPIMLAFIAAVFMVLGGHAKADSVMAGTLIGYLSAKAELVLSYYFGSSAGSDRKTELLGTIAKQP